MSTPRRLRLLAITAAAAGSLGLAPAAHAVAVTPTPANSMSEGYGWYFRFETPTARDKVAAGAAVNIHASYDAAFDPAQDPVVATAVFASPFTYASVQVAVDDKIANPGGQHVWTFFYVPTHPSIELTATSHSVAVSDDDASKQGFLGTFLRVKGRTIEASYTFMEPRASGTLRLKLGKKTIAKKKIRNNTDAGGKTSKVKFRIGAKNYRSLRKKKRVTLEFKGESALRILNVSGQYKIRW